MRFGCDGGWERSDMTICRKEVRMLRDEVVMNVREKLIGIEGTNGCENRVELVMCERGMEMRQGVFNR